MHLFFRDTVIKLYFVFLQNGIHAEKKIYRLIDAVAQKGKQKNDAMERRKRPV
jgi:hypothetical protein